MSADWNMAAIAACWRRCTTCGRVVGSHTLRCRDDFSTVNCAGVTRLLNDAEVTLVVLTSGYEAVEMALP